MIRNTSALLIACLLAACGGGGGGGGGNTASPGGGAAVPADKTSPSAGDFYTYKMTGYYVSNGKSRYDYDPVYETVLTTAVTGGGAVTKTLYGDQYTGWFENSAMLRGVYQSGRMLSCKVTYAGTVYGPPAQLALNASWDNSTSLTRDCDTDAVRTSKLTSKGSVVAIESVSVAGGTFQAYKLVATVNNVSVDKSRAGSSSGEWTIVSKLTSWVDVDTGVEVKRSVEAVETGWGGSEVSSTSNELVGVSHARSGRQLLVVERFAGPGWKGSYSGKLSGTCTANILSGGVLDVRCAEGASTVNTFFPEGTINVGGQVSFAPPAGAGNGLKFTGQAESLTKISGTWSDATGATGTWVFTRDD